MRASDLLLSVIALAGLSAIALAGCGNSSSSSPPACSCPGGACNAAGACVVARPDAGTPATCDKSMKPVVLTSPLANQQHLGQRKVGDTVPFDVPANTVSVTIVEQAVDAPDAITFQGSPTDNVAVPLKVFDPAGATIYDDAPAPPADGSQLLAFFESDSPATGTLTIPNTAAALAKWPNGLPASDKWSLVVSDFAYECTFNASCTGGFTASMYDVTVITKQAAGGAIPQSGSLDVVFYLATTKTSKADQPLPAAAGAPKDADLQRMASTFSSILLKAGITVHVTWRDVPDGVKQKIDAAGVDVDESGACSPLSQLFTNSDPTAATLNIFLVSGFTSSALQPGTFIEGVDSTIPGPAGIGGTVASGAAVQTADLRSEVNPYSCGLDSPVDFRSCGDDDTAYIAAHEAGHFLGLYHVTEAQGTSFDPLGDTLHCQCSSCNTTSERCDGATPAPAPNAEHHVTVTECTQPDKGCGGGENLMFWLFDLGSSQGTLEAQQAKVMLANPLVQ